MESKKEGRTRDVACSRDCVTRPGCGKGYYEDLQTICLEPDPTAWCAAGLHAAPSVIRTHAGAQLTLFLVHADVPIVAVPLA